MKKNKHKKECKFCKLQIGARVRKYLDGLKSLACCTKASRRKKLLSCADPCLIQILRECVSNTLKKRVHIPNFKKLRRHVPTLLSVAKPGASLQRTKKLLAQRGGFLPFILPAIISFVSGAAGEAVGKLVGGGNASVARKNG